MVLSKLLVLYTLSSLAMLANSGPVAAEATAIRFGIQAGLIHLPFASVQHDRLIETHARQAGLGEIKVDWFHFAGGAALNDAVLSDSVDFAETGPPSLIILWAKSGGKYKGLGAAGASPMVLVTRNAAVHSLKDFTEKDRIAVPAVKVSTQAIILKIASEAAFGPGNQGKLDDLTVTLSHPDAVLAMSDSHGAIDSHFSTPPYLYMELAHPDVHAVLSAQDVLGVPFSNGIMFTSQEFHDKNPKIVAATIAALQDALALIQSDPQAAANIYLETSGDKSSPQVIADLLTKPGTSYAIEPQGMLRIAQFMRQIGMINTKPASWRDLFFVEAHAFSGS